MTPRRAPATAVLVGCLLATVPAALTLGILALTAPAATRVLDLGARSPVPDVLVTACGLLGAVLLVVLTLDVLVCTAQEARGHAHRLRRPDLGPPPEQVAPPRLVRRIVALAVGFALGSGALAANASPGAPQAGWASLAPVTPGWEALPQATPEAGWSSALPEHRPVTAPPVDLPGAPRATAATSTVDQVVVHRGDTLWSLALDLLGPGTTDAAVADVVDQLYSANAHVIGEDPDLLRPGQVLHLP